MISVALCTYNGGKYIEQQLLSILNQTMPVDEIIICDDVSSDSTLQIVEKIKMDYNAPIIIYKNAEHIGIVNNFEQAIFLCQGDFIFLSDQDDVWLPSKVQTILKYFSENATKQVIFTNAELINAKGEKFTEYSLWDCVNFNHKQQKQFDKGFAFESILKANRCTGATMVIRKDFRFKFSSLCVPPILHDEVICISAALQDVLGYMPQYLIKYRIHPDQYVGVALTLLKYYSQNKLLNKIIRFTYRIRLAFNFNRNKYGVNKAVLKYLLFPISKEQKKKVYLASERYCNPQKAVRKIKLYRKIYHKDWLSFWLYDILRIIKYFINQIFNKEK